MSTKTFRGDGEKQAAEQYARNPSVLVLYYMDGCPHCIANKSAWNEAKRMYRGPKAEIEASASSGVSGFPTMKLGDKVVEGKRSSGKEIVKELGVKSARQRGTRRKGGARKKTLRDYMRGNL